MRIHIFVDTAQILLPNDIVHCLCLKVEIRRRIW